MNTGGGLGGVDGGDHTDRMLRCGIEELPNVTLVHVAGELDLSNARVLERALDSALQRDKPIIVELSGLGYLDSTGLHLLLKHGERAKQMGMDLVLACPTGFVTKVVRLLELDRLMRVFPDLGAALHATADEEVER